MIKKIDLDIKQNNLYSMFILISMSILPIIDSINGIFLRISLPSIGSVYKMYLLLLLLFPFFKYKLKFNKRQFCCVFIFFIYILLSIIINLYTNNQDIVNASYPIKLVFNILMLFLFIQNKENKIINNKIIERVFENNVVLILICIIIPYFLGVGNSIYAGNIGFKAFYYSQNELTAVLIVLLFFTLYKLSHSFVFAKFIEFFCLLFCLLIMNTKTSIIIGVISILMFIFILLKLHMNNVFNMFKRFNGVSKIIKITLIIVFMSLTIYFIYFIYHQFSYFLMRQTGLNNIYDGNFIATLTSGRIFYIKEAYAHLMSDNFWFIKLLIGNGFVSSFLIEMDFIDILFYLGIIGLFFIISFILWCFKNSIETFKKDKSYCLLLGYILLFAFSFVAGHVLFMATSGTYVVIYLGYILKVGGIEK